jgi:hypothetical protein
MLPNYLALPMLVANVAVFVFLNRERVSTFVAGVRGRRMVNAFRVAGLLMVLVAVSHAKECTIKEQQHVNCTPSCGFNKACVKRELASYETPFVAGVIRDQDFETARAIAKENGFNVTWSNGNDALVYTVAPEDKDWTNYFWTPATSKEHPKLAKSLLFVWHNAGLLALGAFICFLVVHYGGGHEADETNIHDQLDPEYRTGFVNDYHGDDAFEVPDGMHSQHQIVPVRSRSAAAGR